VWSGGYGGLSIMTQKIDQLSQFKNLKVNEKQKSHTKVWGTNAAQAITHYSSRRKLLSCHTLLSM